MLLSAVILFQSTNVYLHLRNFVILQLATTTNIKIKKYIASLFLKKDKGLDMFSKSKIRTVHNKKIIPDLFFKIFNELSSSLNK